MPDTLPVHAPECGKPVEGKYLSFKKIVAFYWILIYFNI
jgi:hypothetical protein